MAELLSVLGLTFALLTAGVGAMAIGVAFRRPCLRGSCGGPEAHGHGGEKLACVVCPRRRRGAQGSDDAPGE